MKNDKHKYKSMDGHRERMREQAVTLGFESFKDYQLVELILCYAIPRVDVSGIARTIVEHFGNISAVMNASREELEEVPGITRTMVDWLLVTSELLRAYQSTSPILPPVFHQFQDVACYLEKFWRDVRPPQSWMIYADFESRLLMRSVICESLSWYSSRCASQMVEEALSIQARYAFLVLFMGVEPLKMNKCELDYLLAISRMMGAIGVELLDCVLVGEAGMKSLRRMGKMNEIINKSVASNYIRLS